METTKNTTRPQDITSATSQQDPASKFMLEELNFTTIQNAFDQGNHEYAAQNYKHAINFYSEALNVLHNDLESVILLHLATAHKNSHQYREALGYCTEVEDNWKQQWLIVPHPDMYWVRTSVLLAQGKLLEAANTLKIGSEAVSAQRFPEKKNLLFEQYKCLMKKIDDKNYLQRLPHEILSKILSFLPWQAYGRLAHACRFWYKFILQDWPGMVSSIDATSRLPEDCHLPQFLERVQSHHVRTVKLDLTLMGYQKTESHIVFDNLIRNKWNKIETLEIENIFDILQLQQILWLNKDTLKKLELGENYQDHPRRHHHDRGLADAVKICRNIHTIIDKVQTYNLINLQRIKTSLTPSSWFPTKLHLNYPIAPESLTQILKKTPFLVSFSLLDSTVSIESMHAIYNYAPQLHHLKVLKTPSQAHSIITTYSQSRAKASARSGLKSLSLMIYEPEETRKYNNVLGSFLKRSHGSLESLDISNQDYSSTQRSLDVLAECGAPNLQVLSIAPKTDWMTSSPQCLSQALLTCPALREVELHDGYIWSDSVYKALGKLEYLTHLSLALIDAGEINDMEKNYLYSSTDTQSTSRRDNLCTSVSPKGASSLFEQTKSLRSFKVDRYLKHSKNVDQIAMDMITTIGTCKSLCNLDIWRVEFNNDQFVAFLKSMKDSNVHTLRIRTPSEPVGEKELKELASLPHVQRLSIGDTKGLGKNFDKAQLFRLFQEHHINRSFFVHIDGFFSINGWKCSSTSTSESLSSKGPVGCLHEVYSIKESITTGDFYNNRSGDKYDDHNNFGSGDQRVRVKRVIKHRFRRRAYCKECERHHRLQQGYDDANYVYSDFNV